MLDAEKNKLLKELTELIESEQDTERFSKLVGELNNLLDEAKATANSSKQRSV